MAELPLLVRLNERTYAVSALPGECAADVVLRVGRAAGIATLDRSEALRRLSLRRHGRVISPSTPLESLLSPLETVELTPRVLGGGGDGGSTGAESRSAYLEMYASKKPQAADPAQVRRARWGVCSLSGEPLQRPVVVDEVGSLFNKISLLEAVLEKRLPKGLVHVQGAKGMVELRGADDGPDAAARSPYPAAFSCPLTGSPFDGSVRMLVHRPTGLVFAEKALRDAPAAVAEAVRAAGGRADAASIREAPRRAREGGGAEGACGEGGDGGATPSGRVAPPGADAGDLLAPPTWTPVNPPEEEARRLRTAALSRLAAAKLAKRDKKKRREGTARGAGGGGAAALAGAAGGVRKTSGGSRSSAAPLAPANATPEVWNSLFRKSGEGGDEFMVR